MRLLIASLLIGSALWAMRALRGIVHPYRYGLSAYFIAFLLHTLSAEYTAHVYGVSSEIYTLVYGWGAALILPTIVLTAGIAGFSSPRLYWWILPALLLLAWLTYETRQVYWQGLNYKNMIHIAEPSVYALAFPFMLALKRDRVAMVFGTFWLAMAVWNVAYLLGALQGYRAQVQEFDAWVPVVLHLASFGWIGLWLPSTRQ